MTSFRRATRGGPPQRACRDRAEIGEGAPAQPAPRSGPARPSTGEAVAFPGAAGGARAPGFRAARRPPPRRRARLAGGEGGGRELPLEGREKGRGADSGRGAVRDPRPAGARVWGVSREEKGTLEAVAGPGGWGAGPGEWAGRTGRAGGGPLRAGLGARRREGASVYGRPSRAAAWGGYSSSRSA